MEQVAEGGTVVLTAEYMNGAGDLVAPTTPRVDIIDADGLELVTNATPALVSLGNYSYTYVVPEAGPVGVWRIHWTGTVEGAEAGGDDWFNVVTPGAVITNTYDLLTLDEAKRALNIPLADTAFDTELASYVTAVSQRLDDLCGPIIKRSVTAEQHDGQGIIWPDLQPVATIGAVTEYVSGTGTTLTAETLNAAGDYTLAHAGTHNSQLRRRTSWSDQPWSGPVTISYVAGRFNSTADVSPKFKQAAAKTLAWLWKGDQGGGSVTFGGADDTSLFGLGFALPNVVVELLALEARPPVIA